MANEGTRRGFAGAVGGAGLGFKIGGPFGGVLGGIGGGLIGAFGGRGSDSVQERIDVDMAKQLAQLESVFAQLRAQVQAESIQIGQRQRKQAVSNLAARGTLRAPVSENVFGRIRRTTQESISRANARLASQEAGIRSGILNQAATRGFNFEQQKLQREREREAQLFGLGGAALTGLFSQGAAGATGGGDATGGFSSLLGFFNRGASSARQQESLFQSRSRRNLLEGDPLGPRPSASPQASRGFGGF